MPSSPTRQAAEPKEQKPSLTISLKAVPSRLQISKDREISFTRAILSMPDTGGLTQVIPHATLGQERGSIQDVSAALQKAGSVGSTPPGEMIEWDVYDLLLAAHPGVAGKVHLFGFKAVLNWWFTLDAWAEFHPANGAAPSKTPIYRWKLRWSPSTPALEEINLALETVAD
jgi:hypothetical protein